MNTKRLRQRVLDLAIHGKLVPQNPQDEPASELLKRIAEEKERLIKEGIIRKGNRLPEQEWPYAIPTGWTWCILDDFAYVASGSTPSKDSFVSKGIPYLKMYNLRNQKIDFYYEPQYIKEEVHNGKLQRSRTEVGDLIMNIVGPPLGKLAIIPDYLPQANFNQAAVLIRPVAHKDILVKYLFYYLQEMSEIDSISTKGSAGQVNISLTQSQNMRIPLPPLAEQHRIVSEVEKYFSLIDILEESENNLQQSIQKAKSKILDFAIKGKLIEQNEEDEPASILLERIKEEKNKNEKKGKIKDTEKINEVPFEVPQGWVWCRIDDIAYVTKLAGFEYSKYISNNIIKNEGIPLFKGKNVQDGKVIYEFDAYIPEEISDILFRSQITKKCLLTPYVGTLGNIGIHDKKGKFHLGSNVGKIELYNDIEMKISEEYIRFYIMSPIGKKQLTKHKKATAQESISIESIRDIYVPLPPLAEQHRIVAKIEELFTQLDNIAEALT